MREPLCVSQSSKEQLRRSRTESSGAAPAIEELPGDARQCKALRAACGFVSTDFRLLTGEVVWRASGPPAPPNIIFSRKFEYPPPPRPRTTGVGNTRFGTVFSHPKRSGGRPAPPAPPGIKPLRKLEYPPPPRPRPAEAGIARFGTISSYRRGLEGARPSSSPEYHFHTEVQHISLIPPTCRSICNQLSICYSKTMEQGENQDGSYAEKI